MSLKLELLETISLEEQATSRANEKCNNVRRSGIDCMVKRYFWNLLISIDQLVNTILGGYPDETLSSRMGKHLKRNKDCFPCKFI
ncbi:hypothetical protein [Terrihalobacillus insolitus]|uniref:hypothetical protein n=1 Tax=Terrihalobacillus insolitus TaxID=2950438 RepID=UPI0023400475|nr:hypothetical protein [Terrihalobacillus insolitus]MDC3412513.1 hypothetical protein [Terrihalobacillus insolitus]